MPSTNTLDPIVAPSPSIWEERPQAVVHTLAALRDEVLRYRSDRRPKWRFRLAPDR